MNLELQESLSIAFVLSFSTVMLLTPLLIRKLRNKGIVGPDANKPGKPKIPRVGGITIVLAVSLASLISMQLASQSLDLLSMLAAITTIILISFLGFMDDILNIRDSYRVVLPAFAALPLMAVKAGTATMQIPFLGEVNFDLGVFVFPFFGAVDINLYVLLLIPIGVVACSNLINLLAGFNGLEAGTGAIICVAL